VKRATPLLFVRNLLTGDFARHEPRRRHQRFAIEPTQGSAMVCRSQCGHGGNRYFRGTGKSFSGRTCDNSKLICPSRLGYPITSKPPRLRNNRPLCHRKSSHRYSPFTADPVQHSYCLANNSLFLMTTQHLIGLLYHLFTHVALGSHDIPFVFSLVCVMYVASLNPVAFSEYC
jgi:hypothetical protein